MKRKLKYGWQPLLSIALDGCRVHKNFSHFSRIEFFLLSFYTKMGKKCKKHTKTSYIGTTYLKTSVEESYGYVIFSYFYYLNIKV